MEHHLSYYYGSLLRDICFQHFDQNAGMPLFANLPQQFAKFCWTEKTLTMQPCFQQKCGVKSLVHHKRLGVASV